METHSENKGNLRDKFEDFQHDPSEAVWERIAATPTDRPLGAKFRGFTWTPGSHVWRGILGELYPQPVWRTAAIWTVAASLTLLAGVGLLWQGGSANLEKAGRFAASDLKLHWGHLDQTQPNPSNLASKDLPNGNPSLVASTFAPSGPKSTNPRTFIRPNGNSVLHPQHPVRKTDVPVPQPLDGFASTEAVPVMALVSKSTTRVGKPTDEVTHRVLFWQTMAMEQAQWSAGSNSAEGSSEPERQSSKEPQFIAQAGSNLSSSNVGIPMKSLALNESHDNFDPLSNPAVMPASLEASPVFGLTESDGENYRTPLVFGAYVDRSLGKGFGVSMGLVYSKLSSYVEASGANYYQYLYKTRQYLGLAANATYTIPIKKRLSSYLSGGLQFDKGLSLQRGLDTRTGATLIERDITKGDAGNFASGNLGLGLRYQVFKHVSLYAQGTAANYFYHTKRNLWTNNAIWPSAQVGIRVGL